jgi:hypothetical protein
MLLLCISEWDFVFINKDSHMGFPAFHVDDVTKVEQTKPHLVSYTYMI